MEAPWIEARLKNLTESRALPDIGTRAPSFYAKLRFNPEDADVADKVEKTIAYLKVRYPKLVSKLDTSTVSLRDLSEFLTSSDVGKAVHGYSWGSQVQELAPKVLRGLPPDDVAKVISHELAHSMIGSSSEVVNPMLEETIAGQVGETVKAGFAKIIQATGSEEGLWALLKSGKPALMAVLRSLV